MRHLNSVHFFLRIAVSFFLLFPMLTKALAHTAFYGNGVVDGNGAPVGPKLQRVPMPYEAELKSFFDSLSNYEPTLTRLFKEGFDEFSGIQWNTLEDNGSCALESAPDIPIRAAFQVDARYVILCAAYHALPVDEKLATLVHEMLHYVIQVQIKRSKLGASEESFVSLIEGHVLALLRAKTLTEYRANILKMRFQFDRDLPELILHLRESDIAFESNSIQILVENNVYYPVPKDFFKPDYFPKHFTEVGLNRYWKKNANYGSELLARVAVTPSSENAKKVRFFCNEFLPSSYPDAFYCHSDEANEKHIQKDKITPFFAEFMNRFKLYTGRTWIQDDKFLYFFVDKGF